MTAVILDVETTGIDEPDVIQLAWAPLLPVFSGAPETLMAPSAGVSLNRYRPRKPISLGAMATHHILDEELEQETPWEGTWSPPAATQYLVAHNIDFDWKAIGSPDIKRICTLALARRLWPDIDSHSLGALIYHLYPRREAREMLRGAHDAVIDADLCYRVLLAELSLMPLIVSWDRLWEASEKARIPTHMTFGKYGPYEAWAKANGGPMKCADVRRLDPGYHDWLFTKCDQVREDPYLRKALSGAA